jgi:AcrR family transcriptional regulator
MTGEQRREQLLAVARDLFAERGFEAASIEEIAHRAGVSKPVFYEHFAGKEVVYAVIVDREMRALVDRCTSALTGHDPRDLLEQVALALLDYVETEPAGFRILTRDSPGGGTSGTFSSLLSDIAAQVEYILAAEFRTRDFDPALAPLYSQALVGMVALVGQWWLDARRPRREVVAAHLVNLAWNGLAGMSHDPVLHIRPRSA